MIEALIIWGYFALGNVIHFGLFASIVGLIICLLYVAVMYDNGEEKEDYAFAFVWAKRTIVSVIIFGVLTAAYPSKSDLKWIIGGAMVWNGIAYAKDIEGAEKLPENMVAAMNQFLESLVEKEAEETK